MLPLGEVAAYLDAYLRVDRYPEERSGVLRDAERPVRRLGIALEASPALGDWARSRDLDALVLHRHWRLEPGLLPPGTGVLAYHLPLDDHLTVGFNPLLAESLGMGEVEPLGERRGRTVGMLGRVRETGFAALHARLVREFGGVEASVPPRGETVATLAVVGAMTDALVREAADRGATLYLTGQLREPARAAVAETGMGVVATGHRRSEQWGLRALAGLLRRRWSELHVEVEGSGCRGGGPC